MNCFETATARWSAMRQRLASEGGFTMLTASMAVFAAMTLSASALTYVDNDANLQRQDRYTKYAMQAVQTGSADYTQQLAVNTDYFSLCDQAEGSHAVNDTNIGGSSQSGWNSPTSSTGKVVRRWMPASSQRQVTGPTGPTSPRGEYESEYSIDLIPANGKLFCKQMSDRVATMVDSQAATFRVRVTGRAGPKVPASGNILIDKNGTEGAVNPANIERYKKNFWVRRSVVIDFRRRGFLDFAYLTDNESKDPALYSDVGWAEANCSMYYRDGRQGNGCTEINFVSGDWIKGPFHTNDSILAQNGSKFGRSGQNDRIEISAATCPVRASTSGGCGDSSPTFYGPLIYGVNAPVLPLPEANEDLQTYGETANGGLTFTGHTTIEIKNNGTIDVTNAGYNGGALINIDYPAPGSSGVIYVKNGAGCDGYDPDVGWNPTGDATCGIVAVKGTYSESLTIAAEDDIVITGNINRDTAPAASETVLGLIANKFVRIRHYATGNSSSCTNQSGTVTTVTAAILALQHSFMVDWWACGNSLGTLTINGAIAQKYRGVVGTGSGSTGYLKNYNYDDRLRYRTPPFFLSPAYAGWRTTRFREQVPACPCAENATLLP